MEALDEEPDLEDEPVDLEDDDFVEGFLTSPSFRIFAGAGGVGGGGGCCEEISDDGGAAGRQDATTDGAVGNKAADVGAVDASTGAVVDDGGREPTGSAADCGADDAQFGGDTVVLPGSSSGCTAVVPFSRTSQFFAGGNIFDDAVAVAGTGDEVVSTA